MIDRIIEKIKLRITGHYYDGSIVKEIRSNLTLDQIKEAIDNVKSNGIAVRTGFEDYYVRGYYLDALLRPEDYQQIKQAVLTYLIEMYADRMELENQRMNEEYREMLKEDSEDGS